MRRGAVTGLVLSALIVAAACDGGRRGRASSRGAAPAPEASTHRGDSPRSEPPGHGPSPSVDALPARSIFQFDATFTDQDGRPYRLVALRGHPALVLMFYGTCESACPLLVEDLLRIDRSLSDATRAKARYLLVSFDPENDTPERLRALARTKGMDPRRFTLVTGSRPDVLSLAVLLDVRFARRGPGDFSHSNVITLLDADGVLRARLEGLGRPVDSITADVERLAR